MNNYHVSLEVYNALDGVLRIIAVLRKAKLKYHRLEARIIEKDKAIINLEVSGSVNELKWLIKKLERIPEVYYVFLSKDVNVLKELMR